ncbi:MAG: hypothetical protein UX61_C0008G0034 [Parcubacteria group bacterium GW2011_GWA2_46_7]|nr:MAG: hypothetical protein UX61_C0008G0034 [Parcubacteria group bacterium GW2011_GWA2_46_7]
MGSFLSSLFAIILWIPFGIAGWVGYGFDTIKNKEFSILEPGIVYSSKQAESLGLQATSTFLAIVNELQPRYIRLVAYWDRIEKTRGVYDFSEIDEYFKIAQDRDMKVTLIIGEKVPRWPECHIPEWVRGTDPNEHFGKLKEYMATLTKRYAPSRSLEYWQVENELFFKFGDCPKPSAKEFQDELKLVRSIDPNHPVLVTGSGEMSTWLRPFWYGDAAGISLYREAVFKTRWFSWRVSYPLPPLFYGYKARVMSALFGKILMVTELQLEPWFTEDLKSVSIKEQMATLSPQKFEKSVMYAAQTRIPRVYLWGVEWWYWLNEQGVDSYWSYVKKYVFKN